MGTHQTIVKLKTLKYEGVVRIKKQRGYVEVLGIAIILFTSLSLFTMVIREYDLMILPFFLGLISLFPVSSKLREVTSALSQEEKTCKTLEAQEKELLKEGFYIE